MKIFKSGNNVKYNDVLKIAVQKSNFYKNFVKLGDNLDKGVVYEFIINVYGEYSGALTESRFNLDLYKKQNVVSEMLSHFGYLYFGSYFSKR